MNTSLSNRAVIRLEGPDADQLLQGIITQDIGLLNTQPVIFSAMLTAQGKFAHDFFIWAEGNERLIEIDAAHKDAFIKKLKMYKLRAQVTIDDVSDAHAVLAAWDEKPSGDGWAIDPRLEALGWRRLASSSESATNDSPTYDAHRLTLGVPEGIVDATDRHFALELGYDQLNGVNFNKGCFVGQEPTARMHYRNVLRKGLFQVSAESELPEAGTPLIAGDQTLGEMRSSRKNIGLAFCRMDPVQTAQTSGAVITAGDAPVTLTIPTYMQSKWERIQQADANH